MYLLPWAISGLGPTLFGQGQDLSEISRTLTHGIRTLMKQNTLENFDLSEDMEAHKWPLRGHDPKLMPFFKSLTQKAYIWIPMKQNLKH